jgi:hypothetical protein
MPNLRKNIVFDGGLAWIRRKWIEAISKIHVFSKGNNMAFLYIFYLISQYFITISISKSTNIAAQLQI